MRTRPSLLALLITLAAFPLACDDGSASEEDVQACQVNEDCPEGYVCRSSDENPLYKVCAEGERLPAWVEVSIDPSRAVYSPKNQVTPLAIAYDEGTEPFAEGELEVTWTVTPASAAETLEDGKFRLVEEGEITFTACVPHPELPESPVCGERTLLSDAGPPELIITSPLPGDSVVDSGGFITVEGIATDTHGTPQVYIDGVGVELQPDGSFAFDRPTRFGIQHIEAVATDGLNGLPSTVELDVLVAAGFTPLDATAATVSYSLPEALSLSLGQPFFDDGLPLTVLPEEAPTTRDLADVLDLVLRNIDYMSQIPNPVVDSSNFTLTAERFDPGLPVIELDLTDAGLEIYLQLPSMTIDTTGSLSIDTSNTVDLTGTITASVAAYASISVIRNASSGVFEAEILGLELAVESATAQFADPEVTAIFELVSSLLRTTIEDLLLDTVQGAFIDTLPALLVDLFNSLDGALAQQTFPLDLGLGEPLTLALDGGIERFLIDYRDELAAGMSIALASDKTPLFPENPGVPLMVAAPPEQPPFFAQRYLQLGVRMALLNGLMQTLFNSGMFELDLTSVLPDGAAGLVTQAVMSGKLQPVLVPPTEGEPYDLILELGQVQLLTELLAQQDTYALNIRAGLTIDLSNNTLSVEIAETPELITWAIDTTGQQPFFNEATLQDLILTQVWPAMRDSLADSLNIALPIPALGDLGGLAPAMAAFTLNVTQELPPDVRQDWLIFDTILRGELPLTP